MKRREKDPLPSLPVSGRVAAQRTGGAISVRRARQLRKAMTRQEVKLWLHLRTLKQRGFHFRRQAPLLGYYADFACLGARLILELDGSHHSADEQADHDGRRDAAFAQAGFHVVRIWNTDVDRNLEGVMEAILQALALPHPSASRPPSP